MGTVGTERRGKRKVGLGAGLSSPLSFSVGSFPSFDPLSPRPHLTPNLSSFQVEISY